MEIETLLKSLTIDDIMELSQNNVPGISTNPDEGSRELGELANKFPILNNLMAAYCHAFIKREDNAAVFCKAVVHLLIFLYKKEQQQKIDELLSK